MPSQPIAREKLIAGLLVWNRTKTAEYLNITPATLKELCKTRRLVPDVITHWNCKEIYWFTKQTLDVYLMEEQEKQE